MQFAPLVRLNQCYEFAKYSADISSIYLINEECIFVFWIVLCLLAEFPENARLDIIADISIIVCFGANSFNKVFITIRLMESNKLKTFYFSDFRFRMILFQSNQKVGPNLGKKIAVNCPRGVLAFEKNFRLSPAF